MWTILESKLACKQLDKCPKHILVEFEAWKQVVKLAGPEALRKILGYRDHALKGNWRGARSSYLNIQWRVIYTVERQNITVKILEVNAHDYRKKN